MLPLVRVRNCRQRDQILPLSVKKAPLASSVFLIYRTHLLYSCKLCSEEVTTIVTWFLSFFLSLLFFASFGVPAAVSDTHSEYLRNLASSGPLK